MKNQRILAKAWELAQDLQVTLVVVEQQGYLRGYLRDLYPFTAVKGRVIMHIYPSGNIRLLDQTLRKQYPNV